MNFMHESLWCLPNCEVNGKADIVKSLAIRAAVLGGVGALMFRERWRPPYPQPPDAWSMKEMAALRHAKRSTKARDA
jgi:hypothetical protein